MARVPSLKGPSNPSPSVPPCIAANNLENYLHNTVYMGSKDPYVERVSEHFSLYYNVKIVFFALECIAKETKTEIPTHYQQ